MEAIYKSDRAASNEEQQANRERYRKEAEALTVFGAPEIPIAIFVEEAAEAVRAGQKYCLELEAVGTPAGLVAQTAGYLDGLRGSQVNWRTENIDRALEIEVISESALKARREGRLVTELALRESVEGQERLRGVEEGDTMPQVIASLTTLAAIVTMFRPEFTAIHVSADELAVNLVGHAEALEKAQFDQNSEDLAAEAKELRDRYYTLTAKSLAALRAFASFAFRNDRSSRRRNLFISGYIRNKNRKQYRKAKAAAEAALVRPPVVSEPAASDPAEEQEVVREAA